jgi:protein-disulfide isomerase
LSTLKIEVTDQDHSQGSPNAPYTLVEYGDYECPHCANAHPIIKSLERHFGDRLRFVFRNFPLTQIHPNAEPAAEVAEFAGANGKFWEMHDLLFKNQSRLGNELFEELVVELNLDSADMSQALENHASVKRIRADFTGGVRSGVNGTPTFFINGQRHNGPRDFDTMTKAIDASIAL